MNSSKDQTSGCVRRLGHSSNVSLVMLKFISRKLFRFQALYFNISSEVVVFWHFHYLFLTKLKPQLTQMKYSLISLRKEVCFLLWRLLEILFAITLKSNTIFLRVWKKYSAIKQYFLRVRTLRSIILATLRVFSTKTQHFTPMFLKPGVEVHFFLKSNKSSRDKNSEILNFKHFRPETFIGKLLKGLQNIFSNNLISGKKWWNFE